MVAGVNILRAARKRAALACLLAAVLVWIGTFTLLQIGAPIAVVALLAVAVGTVAVVQSLAPGAGIGLRPARPPRTAPEDHPEAADPGVFDEATGCSLPRRSPTKQATRRS
jgi:hypothetical protein